MSSRDSEKYNDFFLFTADLSGHPGALQAEASNCR
jgi:hypothetical protein